MTRSAAQRVWLAGALCTLAYLYLAVQSPHYGAASVHHLLWTSAFVIACTVALAWSCHHRKQPLTEALGLIVLFGVLFRIIGVWTFPVLEDDFYRYLWDGLQTVATGSPYQSVPADWFAEDGLPAPAQALLDAINYPDIGTPYGPTAQWLFALNHWLSPWSTTLLQAVMAVADLAILLLLLRTARPLWVLCYAWSPLLIKEFAMTAHIDVLGAALLAAALWMFRQRSWLRVGVLTALACGIKPFALVATPFLLGWQWRGWLAFALVAIGIAWPFGLAAAWLPDGLAAMGSGWYFNAPLHWLAGTLFDAAGMRLAGPILLGLFASIWLWCWLRWCIRWHQRQAADLGALPLPWLLGLLLLILPALNPWYLIWWLPFAALKPWITPWVASAVLLLSYVSGINLVGAELAQYETPLWVLGTQTIAIVLALLYDLRRYASFNLRR